jgi:hypothetical protein
VVGIARPAFGIVGSKHLTSDKAASRKELLSRAEDPMRFPVFEGVVLAMSDMEGFALDLDITPGRRTTTCESHALRLWLRFVQKPRSQQRLSDEPLATKI